MREKRNILTEESVAKEFWQTEKCKKYWPPSQGFFFNFQYARDISGILSASIFLVEKFKNFWERQEIQKNNSKTIS